MPEFDPGQQHLPDAFGRKTNRADQAGKQVSKSSGADSPSTLLGLQRLAGNAAVASLIAQRQGDAGTGDSSGGAGGGGTVTVSTQAFRKQALIQVDSTNGSITDANVTIT